MYIKVTDEEVRLMDIFQPYIKKLPDRIVLANDAPEEVVAAYKKWREMTKGRYDY